MALAIVQGTAKTNTTGGNSTPNIVWGSTPTNGNLMIVLAMVYGDAPNTPPAPASGWSVATGSNFFDHWWGTVYYRYASGESTSITIDTTSHGAWLTAAWEISGVSGTFAADVAGVHYPTAFAIIGGNPPWSTEAFNTANNNAPVLCLGCTEAGAQDHAFCSTSGVTQDSIYNQTGGSLGTNAYGSVDGCLGISKTITTAGTSTQFTFGGNNGTSGWGMCVELKQPTASTITGSASMALSKVSFAAGATPVETGQTTLALSKVSFSSIAARIHVKAAVTMNLNGISISSHTFDLEAFSPLRQFATFN